MNAEANRPEIEQILALLELEGRQRTREYCHRLVVDCEALLQVVLAGRYAGLHSYVYDCHFSDYDPDLLSPEDRDLAALAANGIIPLHRRAVKAARKVAHSHEIPGLFSAHLLYTPSHRYWHLFCIDHGAGRDDGRRAAAQELRYSRAAFAGSPLAHVWRQLCGGVSVPPSVRIRCGRPPGRADRAVEREVAETA